MPLVSIKKVLLDLFEWDTGRPTTKLMNTLEDAADYAAELHLEQGLHVVAAAKKAAAEYGEDYSAICGELGRRQKRPPKSVELLNSARSRGYKFVYCNCDTAAFTKNPVEELIPAGWNSGADLRYNHARTIASFIIRKKIEVKYL